MTNEEMIKMAADAAVAAVRKQMAGLDPATGRPLFPAADQEPNPALADSKDNPAADQKAPSRRLSLAEYYTLPPEARAAMNAGRVTETKEERIAREKAAIEKKYEDPRAKVARSLSAVTMDANLKKTLDESISTASVRLNEEAKQRELQAVEVRAEVADRKAQAAAAKEAEKEASWWAARQKMVDEVGEYRAEQQFGPTKAAFEADFKARHDAWVARNKARAELEARAGKVTALRTYGMPEAEPQRGTPYATNIRSRSGTLEMVRKPVAD